jgi:hypothetical protein
MLNPVLEVGMLAASALGSAVPDKLNLPPVQTTAVSVIRLRQGPGFSAGLELPGWYPQHCRKRD